MAQTLLVPSGSLVAAHPRQGCGGLQGIACFQVLFHQLFLLPSSSQS